MQKQTAKDLSKEVYSRQEYAKAKFWDDRYTEKGGFFDWYAELPQLRNSFAEYGVTKTDKILMVGCGNSQLSQQMYQQGYHNIVNIDISPKVIEQMKQQFPHMTWQVMDATKMTYATGQFDVAIDKGTLDALISGQNFDICEGLLKECMRVLKDSGQFLMITYGSPEGRRKIFQNALPFKEYDYYHCRAELNQMSTLINLMRSNLPGHALGDIIKQKEIFAQTMKEYSIIQLMRRARKNQKQYIIWSQFQKKDIEINTFHPQQAKPQPSEVQKVEPQKSAANKVQKTAQNITPVVNQSPKTVFNYQPKKQPYVFVYSIRPKLARLLDQIVAQETSETLQSLYDWQEDQFHGINGNPQQQKLLLRTQSTNFNHILGAVVYLKKKSISHSSLIVTNKFQQQALNHQDEIKKSVKINMISTEESQNVALLRKTNFSIKFQINAKVSLQNVLQGLKKLGPWLTTALGLYPCPKTYALFNVLKGRKLGNSVNTLLQQYWFPTWKTLQINEKQINVVLSIPPLRQDKEQQAIKAIVERLSKLKGQLCAVRRGYVSYLDLDIMNIASLACLSYTNRRAEPLLEDFWQQDQLYNWLSAQKYSQQNSLYNQISTTLLIPEKHLSKVVSHLLALY